MTRAQTCRILTSGALAFIAALAAGLFAPADITSGAPPAQGGPPPSQEEQLVMLHSPILKITMQDGECDKDGSPYEPAPVDIVLGNPDVELRLLAEDRRVITTAPTTEDIAGLGPDYYLDWPGDPRHPGCNYELDYRSLAQNLPSTVYAHIATEDGYEGIAVQYWFFYYYNDFANKHEGDWEMIQIMYDGASTVEEALEQGPTRTAYSGHAGGETADWDSSKLEKVDGHPVVYVATGSNASYYAEGTWIGTAKRGQVFGCDPTTGPHRTVEPEVVPLPDEPPLQGTFAWLSYEGRWGQEAGDLFSGINGPAARDRWYEPFTWADGLRDFSDRIPDSIIGIDPVGLLCTVVNAGSKVMIAYQTYPWAVGGGLVLMIAAIGGVFVFGLPDSLSGEKNRPTAGRLRAASVPPGFLRRERHLKDMGQTAFVLYRKEWFAWLAAGAITVPMALIIMLLQQIIGLGWLEDIINSTSAAALTQLVGMTTGAIVSAVVVSATVFALLSLLDRGDEPDLRAALRIVAPRLVYIGGVAILYAGALGLLSITVVGIPLAINRAVAWALAGNVVILEDAHPVHALRRSAEIVNGSWLRTAGTLILLVLFVGLPGPVIAFGFLIFTKPPIVETIYPLITALYILAIFPLAFIISGLLYGDLCATRERRDSSA